MISSKVEIGIDHLCKRKREWVLINKYSLLGDDESYYNYKEISDYNYHHSLISSC
jgi:hypothetical protein